MITRVVDTVHDYLLGKRFLVGVRYEIYTPAAKQVEKHFSAIFSDPVGYSFEVSCIAVGMVWTKDVAYGKLLDGSVPPPAHPVIGVPLPSSLIKFIRPVTDGL